MNSEVRELEPDDPRATVCGTCGRGWDDEHVTSVTPAPAGRCPFEDEHEEEEEEREPLSLWDVDEPVTDYGIEVPPWIEQDITPGDVAAIIQGGCDSGAYMPAVTYWSALKTMSEHGDAVWQYLEDAHGYVPGPGDEVTSWGSLACHYVSAAVETWAASVEDELTDAINED